MLTITAYDHDCDAESFADAFPEDVRQGYTFYTSHFAGTPIWQCLSCGKRFTYVECACDVAHYCDGAA